MSTKSILSRLRSLVNYREAYNKPNKCATCISKKVGNYCIMIDIVIDPDYTCDYYVNGRQQ